MTTHQPGAGSAPQPTSYSSPMPVPQVAPQPTSQAAWQPMSQAAWQPMRQAAPPSSSMFPPLADQSAAAPGRNSPALLAFVTSIVGFIFACIPGVMILGWVLLPIAFVLALVSLFLGGTGRRLGVAGLVISVVGTVVGVIVFLLALAVTVSDIIGDDVPADGGPARPGLVRMAAEGEGEPRVVVVEGTGEQHVVTEGTGEQPRVGPRRLVDAVSVAP